jgi:uncharacterized membrane protein
MDIGQFLYDAFGRRIVEHGQYGIIEYIVYGAILLALCFFVIYPILNKKGIKFNYTFFVSLLPYILFGSALHVLEDMHFLPRSPSPFEIGYYFVTPGIYVAIAAYTLIALGIALLLSKKTKWDFYKMFAVLGLIPAVPITFFEIINFKAVPGVFLVLALIAIISAIIIFAFKKLKRKLLEDNLNRMVLVSQLVDGCATFVAIQFFRCGEQHPVSGFFLDLFPFSFVLVKVAIVLLIIYYVDKEIENENLRGFIKFIVAILGFATGTRDLLTLGVGTCL